MKSLPITIAGGELFPKCESGLADGFGWRRIPLLLSSMTGALATRIHRRVYMISSILYSFSSTSGKSMKMISSFIVSSSSMVR